MGADASSPVSIDGNIPEVVTLLLTPHSYLWEKADVTDWCQRISDMFSESSLSLTHPHLLWASQSSGGMHSDPSLACGKRLPPKCQYYISLAASAVLWVNMFILMGSIILHICLQILKASSLKYFSLYLFDFYAYLNWFRNKDQMRWAIYQGPQQWFSPPPNHLQKKKQNCRGIKQLPSEGTSTWASTSGSRAHVHSHYGNFLFNMQSPLKYGFDHHCGFTDREIWNSKM